MAKTLYSVGLILTLLSLSYNAMAHSGMEHGSNMHSLMHIVISASIGLAFITVCFLLSKRSSNGIKEPIKNIMKPRVKK